eukprot:1161251-Pelagomonas_calceolata.AAC.1
MEEDMLFIQDIIISLTKVTVWGRPVVSSCCLIAKGVNTESKSSHSANDIMGEVKEHVFRKTVGRMHNRGPVCMRSAPLVIGQAFTVERLRSCTCLRGQLSQSKQVARKQARFGGQLVLL